MSLDGSAFGIGRVQKHGVAPPILDTIEANLAIVRVKKGEED